MHADGGSDRGGLVPIAGGRELYVDRRGEGSPIVVFESGMGGSRNMWGAVVPAITERTETVIYDRAGLGRSPRDPGPRDLARLTSDFLGLLDQLGDEPVVLVGHSWGGPIIRGAAEARPERVAGLVLVDQTDESCDLFFTKANERQSKVFVKLTPVMTRLGLGRLTAKRQAAQLPEPWAQAMRDEDGTPDAMRTFAAEMAPSTDDLRRLRANPPLLPDVPVTFISGTKTAWYERGHRAPLLAAHQAGAEALPQGRHVRADRSGHMVPFTEPEIVVNEIVRVVDMVRAERIA